MPQPAAAACRHGGAGARNRGRCRCRGRRHLAAAVAGVQLGVDRCPQHRGGPMLHSCTYNSMHGLLSPSVAPALQSSTRCWESVDQQADELITVFIALLPDVGCLASRACEGSFIRPRCRSLLSCTQLQALCHTRDGRTWARTHAGVLRCTAGTAVGCACSANRMLACKLLNCMAASFVYCTYLRDPALAT